MRFSVRRRLPRSSLVAFGLAAACAVSAFVLVQGLARRASGTEGAAGSTTQVVVAVHALTPGATVGQQDVALGSVPGERPPPGAFTDVADTLGKVAVTPFEPGEAVVSTRLAEGGGALTMSVPAGQVGLTVALGTLPDGLAAGDRVDVLATFTTERPYTSTVAADVRILRVSSGESGALGTGGGTSVTFVLQPDAAREVAQAAATGTVTLAVRGYEPVATPSPAV